MAQRDFKIDLRGLDEFRKRLRQAASGELKDQFNIWLEAMGMEFLDVIQDNIIRLGVTDTRALLTSFKRGESDCIFEITNNGLTLKVGTNIQYAQIVNDGHWTTPPGKAERWVPGKWNGDKFEYDKNSKTGMLLKRKWVKGYHYFDVSLLTFERIFKASLERNLQEWLDTF